MIVWRFEKSHTRLSNSDCGLRPADRTDLKDDIYHRRRLYVAALPIISAHLPVFRYQYVCRRAAGTRLCSRSSGLTNRMHDIVVQCPCGHGDRRDWSILGVFDQNLDPAVRGPAVQRFVTGNRT